MKELLHEIIEAGQSSKKELDMWEWVCGTSCCLCGDVAFKRTWFSMLRQDATLVDRATQFADELDRAAVDVFGCAKVSSSIYCQNPRLRRLHADLSGIFTEEELNHAHLTLDHNDRNIAHDFVRLVIKKVEERECQ